MPGFCGNCGAPISGAFCGKCGQPTDAPRTPASFQPAAKPPAQPLAQPAAVAAKKSSGLGKVLFIVGGVLVVLFVAGVGGAFYAVHLVKKKISTYTAAATGGSSSDIVQVAQGTSCALLSKEDLQQILGVIVEKSSEIVENSEPGCAYYTNPAAFAQLQQMAIEQARIDSQRAAAEHKGEKVDNPLELLKDTKDLEGVVKGFGLSQPDKDGRVFYFTLQRNYNSSNWSTMRTALSIVPGFEELSGIGDAAMIGSFGHALYVLKRDTVISLQLLYVPEARTRGADIARKIASHL
ncbi:MAG: hypothetical protein ACYDCG_11550 [Candidatus Acidiferrales bacterium]